MIRKIFGLLVLAVIVMGLTGYWSYRGAVVTVPMADKVLALTYDDGPNPPHTQAMLNMLELHDVKATFFVKGRNVEAFPEGLEAIVAAGHEVGNHSYSHQFMAFMGSDETREELLKTNALIAAIQGFEPVLFRPPYGGQGPYLKGLIDELEMTSILMSTSGLDWEKTQAQEIAGLVLEKIEPGGIILLHDGHGDIDDPKTQNSRAASVIATGVIIETLKSQGYSFVTVGELLAMAEQ
ncbi:MAG: peptidoglycan/xylan/chitin deacetylase (PgdA/CDA1 family) [Halioglobus sp.]|jgi:peptidoglycan/xylan/chitin deacetylase (PgdA/CDA1 family)